MKDRLSSLDLLALVAEMQPLVGSHIDKAYQRGEDFWLRLNVPGGGKAEVFLRVGRFLCLAGPAEKPDQPEAYAAFLRRHLTNARLEAVEQRGFDRVVEFRFTDNRVLIHELVGEGNLVFAKDDVIVQPLRRRTYKARKLAAGETYVPPPPPPDPRALTPHAFRQLLASSSKDVVRTLALDLKLGGSLAEALCTRAAVDKKRHAAKLDEAHAEALWSALVQLFEEATEPGHAVVAFEGGAPADVSPVPIPAAEGRELRPFPTFSEAVWAYVQALPTEDVSPEADALAKQRRRVEELERALASLAEEEARYGEAAELLYQDYGTMQRALEAARRGDDPDHPALARREDVWVLLAPSGGEVAIDPARSIEELARRCYELRKEARASAAKLKKGLDAERLQLKKLDKLAAAPAKRTAKSTRRFWFESFRWFVSSEGFLVLGGKDARSNEALVRRHLKPGDRYVHADVRGAPSVVVKDGAKAGEATLREASAFAGTYSKAWSAGLASTEAYWVTPEQVSKSAESGEYVARGAFVIRGKRNHVHDLPVEAAVGEVVYESERKIMGGPAAALAAHSERYVVMTSGEEDRDLLVKELAELWRVPVEEVQRVMPPGDVRVVERRGLQPPAKGS